MTTRKTARDECGCRYELGERERWIECCPTHEAEWQELHGRAADERRATMAEFDRAGIAAQVSR